MVPLSWFLVFSAAMFCIGLFGVLARKNTVAILMGVELMLNAAMINFLAFWRYLYPHQLDAQVFVIVVFAVAAAETTVGLALIISAYRRRNSVVAEEMDILKG